MEKYDWEHLMAERDKRKAEREAELLGVMEHHMGEVARVVAICGVVAALILIIALYGTQVKV